MYIYVTLLFYGIIVLLYYTYLGTPTTWREARDQIWSITPHPGSMNLQTNKQTLV